MKKVGLYSGTFDPLHEGHIAFATAAQKACGLEKIVFLPEAEPRNKPHANGIDARVAAMQRALSGTGFEVYEAQSRQFTISQTLPELEKEFTGAELVFLIGSDVALHVTDWPDVKALVSRYTLVVGMRKDDTEVRVKQALDTIGASYKITYTEHAHVASTQVRQHAT